MTLDVWAFGVTVWEILTMGGTPFPDVSEHDIRAHVMSGNKLEPPLYYSIEVRDLCRSCWKPSSAAPAFAFLCDAFSDLTANSDALKTNGPFLAHYPIETSLEQPSIRALRPEEIIVSVDEPELPCSHLNTTTDETNVDEIYGGYDRLDTTRRGTVFNKPIITNNNKKKAITYESAVFGATNRSVDKIYGPVDRKMSLYSTVRKPTIGFDRSSSFDVVITEPRALSFRTGNAVDDDYDESSLHTHQISNSMYSKVDKKKIISSSSSFLTTSTTSFKNNIDSTMMEPSASLLTSLSTNYDSIANMYPNNGKHGDNINGSHYSDINDIQNAPFDEASPSSSSQSPNYKIYASSRARFNTQTSTASTMADDQTLHNGPANYDDDDIQMEDNFAPYSTVRKRTESSSSRISLLAYSKISPMDNISTPVIAEHPYSDSATISTLNSKSALPQPYYQPSTYDVNAVAPLMESILGFEENAYQNMTTIDMLTIAAVEELDIVNDDYDSDDDANA